MQVVQKQEQEQPEVTTESPGISGTRHHHVASENMREALRSGLVGANKSELLQRVWKKVDTDNNQSIEVDQPSIAKITTKPEEFLQVHIFGTLCDLWDTPERSAPSQLRCLLQ